jgi:hypothetical protein
MKELNDSIVVLSQIYMRAKQLGLDSLAVDTYTLLMDLYEEQRRVYFINKIHLKAYE